MPFLLIFLMAFGKLSVASRSAEAASPVILTFVRLNLFLKIIKPSFAGIKIL